MKARSQLTKSKRFAATFFAILILSALSPALNASAQELRVVYGEGVRSDAIVIHPWMVAATPRVPALVDDDPLSRFNRGVRLRRAGYLVLEAGALGVGTLAALFFAANVSSDKGAERGGAWAMLVASALSVPTFVLGVKEHVAFERNVREARRWLVKHNWQLAVAPTATPQHAGLAGRLQW